MTSVIDYGAGNLGSVANLLSRLGCPYRITSDPGIIRSSGHVILPGVGEASWAMDRLRESGLDRVVRSLTQPVLGICIGMQLMCTRSEEGGAECLGIFDTVVRRLSAPGLKVPHMGWDTVEYPTPEPHPAAYANTPAEAPIPVAPSSLFGGIDQGGFFYYVHSYAADICPQTTAVTTYGQPFSAALCRDNFYGVQFHPEKSGALGRRLIENFLTI